MNKGIKNRCFIFIVLCFFGVNSTFFLTSCSGGGGGGGGSNAGGSSAATVSAPQTTMSEFKASASAGDTQKMADAFDPGVKAAYLADFQKMKDAGFMPRFAEALETAQEVYVNGNLAKYEIQITDAGEDLIFHIYLRKDSSGHWKIASM